MKRKSLAIMLVMSVIMMFTFTGCGAPSPTDTVKSFLEGFKAGDMAAMVEACGEDASELEDLWEADDEVTKALVDAVKPLVQELDYDLSNEQIDGDKATVDVSITTYDVGKAIGNAFKEVMTQAFALAFSDMSEEELDAKLVDITTEAIESSVEGLEKDKTFNVTVKLVKKDDKWIIGDFDDDEEFANAILGNLLKGMEAVGNDW